MGRKIGCPVENCGGAKGTGTFSATHTKCGIRILSIKEQDRADGDEYKDSQAEIPVKRLYRPLLIKYEVKACSMTVTLWVEFDPGNLVHAGFYQAYRGKGISVPRVAVVVRGEAKNPGVYDALWDCRDQTEDHRILLYGSYKVRILGLEDVTHKDETSIKIMPPLAWNYGIHYAGNTTKKPVEGARDAQKALADGTGFLSEASVSSPALTAWMGWQESAVGVFDGHSNPFAIAFYSEESQPGKPAVFKKSHQSVITEGKNIPGKGLDDTNCVEFPSEPPNALRDVFFILLAGCRGGNDVLAVQMQLKRRSKLFNPGAIDGKHGPKTTAALQSWQKGEKIEPADGTKNNATLAALGVDPSLREKDQTIEVQKKLKNFSKRYDPGPDDGIWGEHTERALTHYQEDHSPPLEVNSLPDKPTLHHLNVDDSTGVGARNVAETCTMRGCNLAFGFVNKVSFVTGEKWHIAFWKFAAAGSGIDDAASEAKSLCGALASKELEYKIYARDGVDPNSTLHPARHGRDM